MNACRVITAGAVAGLLLMGVVTLRDGIAGSQQYSTQQQALEAEKARIAAEKARVTLQRELADAYRDHQILNVQSLILLDYYRSDTPPAIPWHQITDPVRKTQIYDATRVCIGLVENNQFFFVNVFPEVCQ